MKNTSFSLFFLALAVVLIHAAHSQDIADINTCLECHSDQELTGEIDGEEISVFVDKDRFQTSVHADLSCIDCHEDIKEDVHDDTLQKVNCTSCHEEVLDVFSKSVHGVAALERKDKLAPTCATCHGNHYVLPPGNPKSSTYIMNIPATCGRCHKEGTEMTTTHEIDQHNVLSNYSMSIHGEGLFKRGLTVTAVCTSCHGGHNIFDHTNPESTINHENVANTCQKCHAQIETVHTRIIEGKLWQSDPGKVPICVDCHSPHIVKRVQYTEQISDSACMSCHSDPNIKMTKDGLTVPLFINQDHVNSSVHAEVKCINCHFDVHPESNPVCKDIKPVDCSVCHAGQVQDYTTSIHGKYFAENNPNAPSCVSCHGKHNVMAKINQKSPTFPKNIPQLCSQCHADGQPAAVMGLADEKHILKNYSMSIHGKGLIESGLVVTAVCTNCHTAHNTLPAEEPNSTVNHNNISQTCGKCHNGIYETLRESIHSPEVTITDQPLPACSDCHQSHTIQRVNETDFRVKLSNQCGKCHEHLVESYFETYHGKASKLGDPIAAKCSDCHGAHNIFAITDPRSTLSRDHIIDTCKQCHSGSNRQFTGYLTHATHFDKDKYPALFYSFWFMTWLLIGTLTFFGIHSILWFIRSLIYHLSKHESNKTRITLQTRSGIYVRRFRARHSILHLMVIVSFLSLAVTGMTLKFPDVGIFNQISKLLGGPVTTGIIHRIGAVITFTYFGIHLFMVGRLLWKKDISFKGLIHSEYTLLPTVRDAKELVHNFKWFFGKADRPKFGRWTYWEKFDYFAVFWGVAIIGTTGLILWFPETATLLLPGWAINIATIIHSDEALLATGFIFTIHFFNTHFRPGVFPMDPVIFTGRLPLEEFIDERPREYEQLVAKGELDKYIVGAPPAWLSWGAVIFGFIFLLTGLIVIGAILYGMVFVYS